MEKKTRLKRRILIIAVVLIAVAGVVLAAITALSKMESKPGRIATTRCHGCRT